MQHAHQAPIIIKRVKKGHAAHHGGAWKVAYADFVTAMMALFIVLWLMNSNAEIQQAVGGYFRDPQGYSKDIGSGLAGSGEKMVLQPQDMAQLREKIQDVLKRLPELQGNLKNQVQMTVTGEGLRIELLETEKGVFFDTGNAKPTTTAEHLLASMAGELGKLPNTIAIEGHTDSRPFAGNGTYTNWELSSDRANTARRLMQAAGVRTDQIKQVRGFADQRLKVAAKPDDASNRRVSVVVQYMPARTGSSGTEPAAKPASTH
jgi:chemotaxis protein MotB